MKGTSSPKSNASPGGWIRGMSIRRACATWAHYFAPINPEALATA
jgi:hypothetical protein